ncbi:MAG: DUF4389 domain-containing protein [Acidimicrobiia bacterium]|nr:DUF4389 domain-containing protein [Acidimicrobiia bacterium]
MALLLGGGALGIAWLVESSGDDFFDVTIDRIETETVAVTAEDLDLSADPGDPDWVLDTLDADIRLRVTPSASGQEMFVGIGSESDVDTYLSGVAHDEISDINDDLEPQYRARTGDSTVAPPVDQNIWAASATGAGTQELIWEASSGNWAVVLMNADGSPGVSADVNVGARIGFLGPLALILMGIGALLSALAVTMIIIGATGMKKPDAGSPPPPEGQPLYGADPSSPGAQPVALVGESASPVSVNAQLDPQLSRWMWLVKWILAIPHFIVLVFLWIAFVVLTVVAGVAIVFTGSYPRGLFDFNVGVLRWSWRVSYYATTGGIGTDEYPPFSLHPEPGDAATIDVVYPERLSRGLVFVKWFLAIPHLIIVAILSGGSVSWLAFNGDSLKFDPLSGGGVLGLLVLVAGVFLLFTERYPQGLFDLIVGLNRWIYRTVAYVGLMTDDYPPFRLDQGGSEPGVPRGPEPSLDPSDLDLRPGPVDREPVGPSPGM